jgi:hypothetical protein
MIFALPAIFQKVKKPDLMSGLVRLITRYENPENFKQALREKTR